MSDNGTQSAAAREGELTAEQREEVASTRRFDLRRILGGLFVVYGVIVFIVGFFTMGDAQMKQTGGIAINFWTGGAMFVAGLLFFLWDRLSPVPAEDIVRNEELQTEAKEQDKAEGLITE